MQSILLLKHVDCKAHYSVLVNAKSLHTCIYCTSVTAEAEYNVSNEYLILPYMLFVYEAINAQTHRITSKVRCRQW